MNIRVLSIVLALFVCVQSYAQTDSLRISIASAWSLVKEQHLLLKVKEKEVEAAQAASADTA